MQKEASNETMEKLAVLRDLIDEADLLMLNSISTHLKLSLKVEKVKRMSHVDILDSKRYEEKRAKIMEIGTLLDPPLDESFCNNLWALLHDLFLAKQSVQRQNAKNTTTR